MFAVAGAFVFWHTGGRGGAVCERERFVTMGDLSLWPPGVSCTYGEPAMSDVFINPWFLMTLVGFALVFAIVTLRAPERKLRT
jgi:hypothetical protein